MIDGRRCLGLITARGGSKGIPGKNVRPFAGKPLIAWTIEAALGAAAIDRLVVSTDDEAIRAVCREHGAEVPFLRPAALASDAARSIDVIHHAMAVVGDGFDYLVLLQPTSPLRRAEDIDGAVTLCHQSGAPACISVSPTWTSTWLMVTQDGDTGRIAKFADGRHGWQRQMMPELKFINGAVYVARWDWLATADGFMCESTVGYPMPRERSVDIDEPMDLVVAEALLAWGGSARR